jgi:hypothetical protein
MVGAMTASSVRFCDPPIFPAPLPETSHEHDPPILEITHRVILTPVFVVAQAQDRKEGGKYG